MRVTPTTVDSYTVQAHIVLERSELDEYVRRTKEQLAKEVTVEGFRKGKAPQHLADSQMSESTVRAEALEVALGESFTQAAQEQGWDIARTSDLKVERNDGDGLEYSIMVHLWPAISLPHLSTVKVPVRAVEVSDADIDEALDTVRTMRSTFLDKTGAAAQGDRVEIDFDASVDGQPVQGGSSQNHPLVIGGKSFMPGFEEELIGLTPGMTREFSLTAPADYYEASLAGKKVDFKVALKRLQAVLKPAADDVFARSLGNFDTIHAVRDSLKQGILNEKRIKEQQRHRLAILDAILATTEIPAPDQMVAAETGNMVHRFSHDLRQQGIELPMYLARLGKTEEQLKADWRPEAQRQVRIVLVLRQIAKEQGIAVGAEELDTAVQETISQLVRGGQAAENQIDADRIRGALAERMLREKVLGFLEQTCKE
jgi:trigger factor